MKLRAYTRVDTGVAVVELEGAVTLGEEAALLRAMVAEALTEGYQAILLDLEGVSYIDSGGLGELISCHAQTKLRGGQMKLLHLNKKVQGLLQITKLITVFETFDDERTAVHSFERRNGAGI